MTATEPVYRYRSVECRTWDDEKFVALSAPQANAQTLWLYLLTGRSTGVIPGLYVFSVAEVAERFGWTTKATRACFDEILKCGMAVHDERTRLLWLPNALSRKCNQPASPNVVRSWGRAWIELPPCELKARSGKSIRETLASIGEGFAKAFDEAFAKGSPKPSRKP